MQLEEFDWFDFNYFLGGAGEGSLQKWLKPAENQEATFSSQVGSSSIQSWSLRDF